ncbi:unnamed protein product [Effrenium voratum]|uniref:Uncharacterized protein n=1 Tax=Effrenium voratum TaxID=2562239 RepID=A0AA36IBF0_9DINO|nr:unnamed protein product [Effrenium voratum]
MEDRIASQKKKAQPGLRLKRVEDNVDGKKLVKWGSRFYLGPGAACLGRTFSIHSQLEYWTRQLRSRAAWHARLQVVSRVAAPLLKLLHERTSNRQQAPSCGNFDLRDPYALDAGQLLTAMSQELQRAGAPVPARPADHILTARRVLQSVRRVEEFVCLNDEEGTSFAVVSRAAGRRPFLVPAEDQAPVAPGREVRSIFDELARQAAEWPAALWQSARLRGLADVIPRASGTRPGRPPREAGRRHGRHRPQWIGCWAAAGGAVAAAGRPAAEVRKAWALTAHRVLDIARRLEEEVRQAEASEAPDEQSEAATLPTLESGTTLDVAATSFSLATSTARPSSSGPEIGRVDKELKQGEDWALAAAQHIALQREYLRAGIRTCPEGHELQEREGRTPSCHL